MSPGDLLERAPQLETLHACLRSAQRGVGTMVFVGGEAGIGKTALIQAFCAELASGVRVLMGGCDVMATPRALAPLFDIADDVGEEFRALLAGDERSSVFDRLLAELRTRKPATVMVLEDVHWADDATLDLLRFLGRRIGSTPALVVATYRDDEAGPRHPLRTVIGDLATSTAVTRLAVTALSNEAVAQMVQSADISTSIEAEQLHRTTGGNPFFVSELLASREDELPVTVQDAVLARAARLPEAARHALDLASVIGPQIDPTLLHALGAEIDAVEACVAAGMLQSSGQTLVFRHELVRDALHRALSVPRRRELHRRVFDVLEAGSVRRDDLATLAHHAAESGAAEAVLRIVPAAARRAAQLDAHKEARAQYARALPYLERLPESEQLQLLEAYATECSICDDMEESARVRRDVVDRWRRLDRSDRVGLNLSILAQVYASLGRNADGARINAEAIEVLERLEPGRELARAYWYQANLAMQDRDPRASIEWGKRAIELADSLGDVAMAGNAHLSMGTSLLYLERQEGREHIGEAMAIARKLDLPHLLTNARLNLGSVAAVSYRFDEAVTELTRAIELAEEHDHDYQRLFSLAMLALTHLHRGEWSGAADAALRVLQRPRVSPAPKLMAQLALGRLRVRRGDPEADTMLGEALVLATRTGNLHRVAWIRAARAEAAVLKGDLGVIGDETRDAYRIAVERRQPWIVGELGYWLWTVGEVDSLPDFAAEPFALQVAGRSLDAARAWQQLGCPYEAARARAESDDEMELRAALEAFTTLGARPAAALAARRLRELGASNIPRGPRSATRDHPAHLTPREVEVLALIAQGLRNAEIAQQHAVSTKTVEHHVSSILAKLDARSRMDAVLRAQQLGLQIQPRQDVEAGDSG